MSDVRKVTQAQFAELTALLEQSRAKHAAAKLPGLTLAEKLALQREAQALRDRAMAIGA